MTRGDLPEALRARVPPDLIVFDGECVLCSRFFRLVTRIDRTERFAFATAQSTLGQDLYSALGLPLDDFETNLIFVDGTLYTKLDSFAAAMRAVGWPWRAFSAVRFIPEPLKGWLYTQIARNRYAIFGRYGSCLIPDAALKARFVDGAI